MTGGILALLWMFWTVTIWMFERFAAGNREERIEHGKRWLFAALSGVPMTLLTCSFWWLAALFVIAAGAAVMRKAAYGAPLVLAAALAVAIVTAVFGSAVRSF